MAIYNFRTASVKDAGDRARRLADLNADAVRILNNGGVERFHAENKWRMDAARVLRESIIDEWAITDPTPIFTERREGVLGVTYEFERPINTFRVVEYSPMSHPNVFTLTKAKHTIKTDSYELAVGVPLQMLLTGQQDIAHYSEMAGQAMTKHNVELVLTAIDVACAAGAEDKRGRPLRTMAAGTDVAKAEIDAALRRIYQNGSGATIYGTRYALDPIFEAAAAMGGDASKEELVKRGVIGRYRGANLVAINDDYNEYYEQFTKINGIDWEKLIFISSGQPGAILLERDVTALQWNDVDPKLAQWSMGIRVDHGILVHEPYRNHVIEMK